MFRLDNRVALVTGGSRGIGKAICEVLAEQGATVLVNYARSEAEAAKLVAEIVARGGKAELAGFDVGQASGAEEAVASLAKRFGRLDILVANAGIVIDGLLLRLKYEDLERMFHVNVVGALACAKAAARVMLRAKWGRVVFTSSVVGEMGNVGQVAYSASKAALFGINKSLARELAGRGITVNAVAPGFINTDMVRDMSDEAREATLNAIPLGRMGEGRDVAAAVAYLASEEAGYMTGQVLRVNGGMYV